jgi:hypothetical protein
MFPDVTLPPPLCPHTHAEYLEAEVELAAAHHDCGVSLATVLDRLCPTPLLDGPSGAYYAELSRRVHAIWEGAA